MSLCPRVPLCARTPPRIPLGIPVQPHPEPLPTGVESRSRAVGARGATSAVLRRGADFLFLRLARFPRTPLRTTRHPFGRGSKPASPHPFFPDLPTLLMAPWTNVVAAVQDADKAVVAASPPAKLSPASKKQVKVHRFCVISWARGLLTAKPEAGPKRVEH